MVDEARAEARRVIAALQPFTSPVVGIEPSSLTTLRDEFLALLPGEESRALAKRALLLSELLERDKPTLAFKQMEVTVHIHGHCHQKAFGAFPAAVALLKRIPGVTVKPSHLPAAAWPARLAIRRKAWTHRRRWRNSHFCRRCVLRGQRISSSPMAHPAGIKSVILARERQFIPCGFWTAPWHERR
jgi:hypothetical protein